MVQFTLNNRNHEVPQAAIDTLETHCGCLIASINEVPIGTLVDIAARALVVPGLGLLVRREELAQAFLYLSSRPAMSAAA